MDDGEHPPVPEGLQHRKTRVEREEAVEIDSRVLLPAGPRRAGADAGRRGPADGDAGSGTVVVGIGKRHDHVQAVDGAALKDGDQLASAARGAGRERGPGEKGRCEAETDQCERAVLQEHSSGFMSLPAPPALQSELCNLNSAMS